MPRRRWFMIAVGLICSGMAFLAGMTVTAGTKTRIVRMPLTTVVRVAVNQHLLGPNDYVQLQLQQWGDDPWTPENFTDLDGNPNERGLLKVVGQYPITIRESLKNLGRK